VSNAAQEGPNAPLQDGVLTMRVAKREEAKPRAIEIQSA
jgi:HSP20 family molecular chaperone IbpA